MVNTTPLERQCLNNIVRNIYAPCNGGRPSSYEETGLGVWSWALTDDNSPDPLPKRSCPGVVASLVKKGLAECYNSGTADAAVNVTPLGFEVWLEHFPPEQVLSDPPVEVMDGPEVTLQKQIRSLPTTFMLRDCGTAVFRVNKTASYVNDDKVPMIVIQKLDNSGWLDHSKSTFADIASRAQCATCGKLLTSTVDGMFYCESCAKEV